MYIRTKLQQRALNCLKTYTESHFSGWRVTRGYVVTNILDKKEDLLSNEEVLEKAFKISDKKKGPGIPVNLNITSQAYNQMNEAKQKLDQYSGRSLFPAQVLEILLICATIEENQDQKCNKDKEKNKSAFEEELIKFENLNEMEQRKEIYKLLLQLTRR